MDHTAFLARYTGLRAPGRLALVTKKVSPDLAIAQSDFIVEYITVLYDLSCKRMANRYKCVLARHDENDWFLSHDDASDFTFEPIRDCCYPYIFISEESIISTNSENQWRDQSPPPFPSIDNYAYDLVLAPVDHYQTIGSPAVTKRYLYDWILRLIQKGYIVEVGLSIVPIPSLFAFEHSGVVTTPTGRVADIIQAHFPMPNLAEIDDSIADGTYKRRNASSLSNIEYQLFFSQFWKSYKTYLRTNKWIDVKYYEEIDDFKHLNRRIDRDLFDFDAILHRCTGAPASERVRDPVPKRFGYFDALRTDYSLARLRHYTHTTPHYIQPYVLFTNYAKYVRRFVLTCIREMLKSGRETARLIVPQKADNDGVFDINGIRKAFTEDQTSIIEDIIDSGRAFDDKSSDVRNVIDAIDALFVKSDAQMPAYHYIAPIQLTRLLPGLSKGDEEFYKTRALSSMSLINIGVGPSNAKNITDHIAVTRPLCWLMVGHCGGLRHRQRLGDYLIGTGYVRRDGVLDAEVPLDLTITSTRVVNVALLDAAAYHVSQEAEHIAAVQGWQPPGSEGLSPEEAKKFREEFDQQSYLRTRTRAGIVWSTADRNWETAPTEDIFEMLQKYRATAVDMESATLAANAWRFRVPHGTFLCVSDRPLHGVIKMKINSEQFYANQVNKHLAIAIDALKLLDSSTDLKLGLLEPRELYGLDDPPWR